MHSEVSLDKKQHKNIKLSVGKKIFIKSLSDISLKEFSKQSLIAFFQGSSSLLKSMSIKQSIVQAKSIRGIKNVTGYHHNDAATIVNVID